MWFASSVKQAFGTSAAIWYALFQASQFHIIYYASRTLPNIFALVFSTIALRSLLKAYAMPWSVTAVPTGYRLCLYLLTISGVIFRSELAILVATITIYLFVTRGISIPKIIIPAGLSGAVIGLLTTIPIDSFFWQSFPLWPEWTGFYYNTIQGHSAEWGVSPWHFYFANALPRLMLNPLTYLLCIPVALLNASTRRRSLDLLIPLLSFVGVYSVLPHKEWRFIIYIIPGLTAVAAAGASWIWTRRAKSLIYGTLSLAVLGSVVLSFAASTAVLAISSLNYPGGAALDYLHNNIDHLSERHFQVFFDNLACQTGVTRFLESHDGPQTILDVLEAQDLQDKRTWTYDKTEDPELLLDPMFWSRFDYVLAERPEKVIGSWEVVHTEYGFGGIRVLKPGQKGGMAPSRPIATADEETGKQTGLTAKVASAWKTLEGILRYRFLRGYWIEVRMDPKINILENQLKSPPKTL
ncbi:Alg9-like mannosyltransferase family-domain-containing protein [Lophiotrema nucula]|uniref:Mannosyltransferase n=1 Tax=Lophiotrema nucula TaxID=690887 RepID=A0A6A5ZGM6_9PLEO|nr:Alg9-like mannosyltransferase family-domain-containing protein [Lophiotrema nucula]